jgi:hypothetical protein
MKPLWERVVLAMLASAFLLGGITQAIFGEVPDWTGVVGLITTILLVVLSYWGDHLERKQRDGGE